MNIFWETLASVVEFVAISGSGFFSWGASYMPKIPEGLLR